ncbi:MAG TPA: PilZ domain-containing protein [Tepidisphaeraceae bacterium]|nr:PilZ domain-containing protein [Tepidisphaeraceae bacterium]
MELSAELLHSTVASANPPGERREHVRVPLRFKVKAIPFEDRALGEPFFVWTRDICPGGIGIIYHKPMREGKKFIIRLPRQDDTPILLLCTVRVCKQVVHEVFNIGASFTEVAESPTTDLRTQVTEAVQPPVPMKFVGKVANATDLTEEVRRISDAILS